MSIITGQTKFNEALHDDACDGNWTLRVNDPCNAIVLNEIKNILDNGQTYSASVTNFEVATISTAGISADLSLIYNEIIAVPVTNSLHPAAYGLGETLPAGVYSNVTAITISGNLTMDGGGNPNALFIIKSSAAFNVAAGSTVNLINGASSKNIFWIAEGAIGIGASVNLFGTIFSHGAAISVGSTCNISGRLLTTGGAVAFGPGNLSYPTDDSFINLRSLRYFVMFTANGGVSNAGGSNYSGSIGTNLGAITGFEAATITNGRIFQAGESVLASPLTDIFSIIGSSTRVVKITKIGFSGIQNISSTIDMLLVKRSTASSLGGSAVAPSVPMDSLSPASSAIVYSRATSPKILGVDVGSLRSIKINISTILQEVNLVEYDFTSPGSQPVTLRGVQESLNINISGSVLNGGRFNLFIEWTESL